MPALAVRHLVADHVADQFALVADLHEFGAADVARAFAQRFQRGGDVVAGKAANPQHPARHAVLGRLLRDHDTGARLFIGHRAEGRHTGYAGADRDAANALEVGAGVADADLHALFFRRFETPVLQPLRQARGAAGAIDHQVGGHAVFHGCVACWRTALGPARPGDPALIETRRQHIHAGDRTHARQRQHALPDFGLDGQAAGCQRGQPGKAGRKALPAGFKAHVGKHVAQQPAARHQGRGEAGEQLFQHQPATRQQAVRLQRVRRALARCGARGQFVAFEQQHLVEAFAQHTGSQQAGQAGAEHDGALGGVGCHRCAPP